MAPQYKLTYFGITGLAEPIRFLLSYGNIEFEDVRVEKDKWPELKSKFPLGQLPVLEHQGKVAYQSVAICRYLAQKVKLNGKDDWEDMEINAVVDTIVDLRIKYMMLKHNKGNLTSEMESHIQNSVKNTLDGLETAAKQNNGHFVSKRLTWADVYFAGVYETADEAAGGQMSSKYPNMAAVNANVRCIPSIKTWIDKRPANAAL